MEFPIRTTLVVIGMILMLIGATTQMSMVALVLLVTGFILFLVGVFRKEF